MELLILKPDIDQQTASALAYKSVNKSINRHHSLPGEIRKVYRAYYLVDSIANINSWKQTRQIPVTYLLDTVTLRAIPVVADIDLVKENSVKECEIIEQEIDESQIFEGCKNSSMTYLFQKYKYYPECVFYRYRKIYRCFFKIELADRRKQHIYIPADNYTSMKVK